MTDESAWRVVLADDEVDLRLLLRHLLHRDGRFEIVGEVGDGRAAIDTVRRLVPDLVVLDLSMPTMDGFQALPEIRKASPASRVVVLSGLDAGQAAARAMELGADLYVEKGSAFDELPRLLAETLDAAR